MFQNPVKGYKNISLITVMLLVKCFHLVSLNDGKMIPFLDEQNLIGSKAAQYVGTMDGDTLPYKQINKSHYFAVLSHISRLQMLCINYLLSRKLESVQEHI